MPAGIGVVTLPWGVTLYPLAWFASSHYAVRLFFILSGFVLALPYLDGRREMRGVRDALSFYARRARRLLPLLAAVLLVAVLLRHPATPAELLGRLWLNVRALLVFDPAVPRPPDDMPLWSLRVELYFSLLLPLLLLVRGRRAALWLLAGSAALSVLTSLAAPPGASWLLVNGLPGRLVDFILGVAVAAEVCRGVRPPRWLTPFALCLAAAGLMTLQYGAWLGLPAAEPFAGTATVVAFALLLLSVVAAPGRLAVMLAWRPLQMAGLMCYSLYVWHPLFLYRPFLPRSGDPLQIAGYLAVLLAVSLLSYRFIEFGHVRSWRSLLPERANY